MKSIIIPFELISYYEMVKIISPKFKATHDELRYWIKIAHNLSKDQEIVEFNNYNYLNPYASDFQFGNMYISPPEGFFYPEYYFYNKAFVELFIPPPFLRFVYRKDLTGKRNWHDLRVGTTDSVVYKTLYKANECGILRMYDKATDDFTLFASDSHVWVDLYPDDLNHPDTFFLLFDILNIERVFFNKSKEQCIKELGISPEENQIDGNVIKFKRKDKKE